MTYRVVNLTQFDQVEAATFPVERPQRDERSLFGCALALLIGDYENNVLVTQCCETNGTNLKLDGCRRVERKLTLKLFPIFPSVGKTKLVPRSIFQNNASLCVTVAKTVPHIEKSKSSTSPPFRRNSLMRGI